MYSSYDTPKVYIAVLRGACSLAGTRVSAGVGSVAATLFEDGYPFGWVEIFAFGPADALPVGLLRSWEISGRAGMNRPNSIGDVSCRLLGIGVP